MSPRTALALVAALAAAAAAAAHVLSSPEPEADPLFGPSLFVSSAGRSPVRGPMLADGSNICPADFPDGFSILCEGPPTAHWARFFVDGRFQRVENFVPYYINGDFQGNVIPWASFPAMATIMCKLDDGSSVSAAISFSC